MQIEIVMYHYVRPIDADRFPHLNVLTLVEFERQLEFFKRHKSFVDFEQIKEATNNGKPLPKNSIWLTFDDGYADHINHVAPILEKNDVRAAFFPVIESSFNKKLLDVNAIQHIIASSKSDKFLITVLKSEMSKLGLGEQDFDFFWTSVEKISRYDRPEIKFFKNLLQKTLPSELRSVLIDRIFEEVVNISKDELSKTLYMDINDIGYLHKKGHTIGSHSYSHPWLNSLERSEQENEIDLSLNILGDFLDRQSGWIMCYPFGGYDKETIKLLKKKNCFMALTTKVGVADLVTCPPLALPRLNTNDYPK